MFEKLASFVYRNSGRVLLVALVGVGVAGVFGLGVAKRLSPYGDTDPSTQSVQATNRYQAATGRQIDPGVIALVTIGDVHSASAERRVRQVEARLRSSRDVAAVSSYYDSHDPAMLSRDGRSTYVVAYFRPKSDSQDPGRRSAPGAPVRRRPRCRARRSGDRERAGQHAGRQRSRARRAARVPVHLPALAAVLPLAGRVAAAAAARRPGDPRHLLRVADRVELHRPVGVRSQHRHRPGARAGDRLQPVHGLPLPRGVRSCRLRRRRAPPHARNRRPDDRCSAR